MIIKLVLFCLIGAGAARTINNFTMVVWPRPTDMIVGAAIAFFILDFLTGQAMGGDCLVDWDGRIGRTLCN